MTSDILLVLDSTLRMATPLILAAMAGLISERSGVIDIGLEGKMLAAAFASAATASATGSAWAGLFVAIPVSVALGMLHGFASITHKGNQIVSGVAINILVAGLAIVLGMAWFQQGGQTPLLPETARFMPIDLPLAGLLEDVPLLGALYSDLVSGHGLLVYVAYASPVVIWWVIFRTRFGLRLRAVGENPGAVDTAGISVERMRYQALVIGGVLCGIAGAHIAISDGSAFVRDMTAGRGFIALAAMILGKWKPVPVLGGCLLFGFLDAISIRLQGVRIEGLGEVPVSLVQALPYVLTVILLAGFMGRAIPPKASGTPFVKER
jgi:ABC-type uncharacterized transport system permease subunit